MSDESPDMRILEVDDQPESLLMPRMGLRQMR